MVDKISKEARSKNMAQIKSKNTKPELIVRKYLFSKGMRFRVNDKRYPGKPDIVLPKYKTIIFINGCFWHHHGCKNSTIPKSNTEFWSKKIKGTMLRDKKYHEELELLGWRVLTVWECELKHNLRNETLINLYTEIVNRY